MTFECLYNYYLIEGDLEMFCINNNFVGVEPKCRVRPFMEKASLSFFIALVSFSIPAIWLAVDFGIFVHLRRKRRSVSFSPIAKRGRINVLKCRDSVGEHIVRDIMNYISATDLDKKSEQPGGKMYGYGNHEDAEDIFANKTGVRRHGSKKSVQDGKEFELLGAARAFGKIGKILEKNLF